MTWTWRPTDDPTPPQHRWSAVDVAAVGALARARAVEPAQQGRSSRVALGSRPLRSGSGSEWDPGSCLPCSTTPYWRRPLSPISTVVNVRSHLAAGSTRISSNASYLMEPATCCCDQLISYPSPRLPQNQPLLPLVPLAITDEASPSALRSTRNRPRTAVRRGAARPRRSDQAAAGETLSRAGRRPHRRACMGCRAPQAPSTRTRLGVPARGRSAWWPRRSRCRPRLRHPVRVLGRCPVSGVR
jgi:hypothetical protein